MPQEAIISSSLLPAQRRRILGAISAAVRRTFDYPAPPNLPAYPDAIPEIDRHIEELVRVVRESEPLSRAAQIVKHSCPACPTNIRPDTARCDPAAGASCTAVPSQSPKPSRPLWEIWTESTRSA